MLKGGNRLQQARCVAASISETGERAVALLGICAAAGNIRLALSGAYLRVSVAIRCVCGISQATLAK
jgi:hypothetical protein